MGDRQKFNNKSENLNTLKIQIRWIRLKVKDDLEQGQQIFSVRGQIVNILEFVDHCVPVASTQCWHSAKTARDYT